jgi:hypothetical protein
MTYNNKATLFSREIQTAVCLVFPGELTKHTMSEVTQAVTKFSSALKSGRVAFRRRWSAWSKTNRIFEIHPWTQSVVIKESEL